LKLETNDKNLPPQPDEYAIIKEQVRTAGNPFKMFELLRKEIGNYAYPSQFRRRGPRCGADEPTGRRQPLRSRRCCLRCRPGPWPFGRPPPGQLRDRRQTPLPPFATPWPSTPTIPAPRRTTIRWPRRTSRKPPSPPAASARRPSPTTSRFVTCSAGQISRGVT